MCRVVLLWLVLCVWTELRNDGPFVYVFNCITVSSDLPLTHMLARMHTCTRAAAWVLTHHVCSQTSLRGGCRAHATRARIYKPLHDHGPTCA